MNLSSQVSVCVECNIDNSLTVRFQCMRAMKCLVIPWLFWGIPVLTRMVKWVDPKAQGSKIIFIAPSMIAKSKRISSARHHVAESTSSL